MSKYNDTLLTTAGQILATRAANGSAKFSITRAVGSKTDLSGKTDAELAALTALPEETQVAQIVAELDDPDGSAGVTGTQVTFQNKNESATIDEGYYLNTIGLYAKEDGSDKEILYALTTADEADYIPDYADNVFYKFTITIYVVVGQKAAVTVAIDVTGTASIEYVDNAVAKAMQNLPKDIARTGADNHFTGTNGFQKATVKGVDVATTTDVTTAVSTATANMVDSTKATNFTAGLQSGGVNVATAADLKSLVDSTWVPIKVSADWQSSPVLMKYDSSTGNTDLIGAFSKNWSTAQGTWKGVIFTLPTGFEWTSGDKKIFGSYTKTNVMLISLGPNNDNPRELMAQIQWFPSSPSSGVMYVSFIGGDKYSGLTQEKITTSSIRKID